MTHTAVELAAAVRSGTLTALEATRAALERMTGDEVGAFQVVRGDKALAEAAGMDARSDLKILPLAGVPIAIKDNIPVAGEPLRDGSAATSDRPQTADHPVVKRLRWHPVSSRSLTAMTAWARFASPRRTVACSA